MRQEGRGGTPHLLGVALAEGRAPGALLEELAQEGEHEEGEDCAPDERVEDHKHPPERPAVGRAQRVRNRVSRLPQEALEDQEQDEVQHAQRHVCQQKRFHSGLLFAAGSARTGPLRHLAAWPRLANLTAIYYQTTRLLGSRKNARACP